MAQQNAQVGLVRIAVVIAVAGATPAGAAPVGDQDTEVGLVDVIVAVEIAAALTDDQIEGELVTVTQSVVAGGDASERPENRGSPAAPSATTLGIVALPSGTTIV